MLISLSIQHSSFSTSEVLSVYSLPKNVYRERIDFSKIKTTIPIPNLIEIQKKSYERFLQMNRLPPERQSAGPAAGRTRSRRPAVGVQVGLPDQRLPRELVARVHRVLDRELGMQVRPPRRPAPPAPAARQPRPPPRGRAGRR